MKNKKTVFIVGKNGICTDSEKYGLICEPNSNIDKYYKDSGKLKLRRKYDKKGYAYKEISKIKKAIL